VRTTHLATFAEIKWKSITQAQGVTVYGHGQMLSSFMLHNHGMKNTSLSNEIASGKWAN
jgi:hypothetical protein